MQWSFSVGRVSGIDLRVHISFFLLLLLGPVLVGPGYGVLGAVFGSVLLVLLFLCVVLHELAHSLASQRLGLKVRQIVLLPIGGLAQVEGRPAKPWHELAIALMGPLVNLALAVVFAAALAGRLGLQSGDMQAANKVLEAAKGAPGPDMALAWLLMGNSWLLLFNLIPAFPMDGGRMLRALLAMVMPQARATFAATVVGQAVAVLIGIYGFKTGSPLLMVIAVFVFFGAGREQAEEKAHEALETMRVGDAYNKHALTLAGSDPMDKVVEYILTSYQPDFAVVSDGRLEGVVTRDDILRALAVEGEGQYVAGIMRRDVVHVQADQSLDEVREHLQGRGERLAAVYRGDEYLGLVSLEDIDEALLVISFRQRARQ